MACSKPMLGVTSDDSSLTYLRPETAQGILQILNKLLKFPERKFHLHCPNRKSFRNEINTKDFIFRVREFEQAEMSIC